MALTYSNPRKHVVIEDWPSGKQKTRAEFMVEVNPQRGERAVRVTVNPKTGRNCAPKVMTYADKVRYVDGSDGKLYLIELSRNYGFVTVMKGTFNYQEEVIHTDNPRHAAVLALFDEVTD